MRAIPLGVALATAALLVTAAAAAQQVNPCKYDADKLCKNLANGGERIACLAEHQSELSAACQAHLNKHEMRKASRHKQGDNPNRAWFSMCGEDLKKLCSDVPAGRGQLAKCLEQHESALSPNCKTAWSSHKAAQTAR